MQRSVNALGAALFSSLALVLLIAAVSSCSFASVEEDLESNVENGTFGTYCQGHFDLSDDPMWFLPMVFASCALALGAICFCASWVLAMCSVAKYTSIMWTGLSVASAICALLCIPVFLLFESEPCSESICAFSIGAVLFVLSVVCWIAVTVVTQFLDPRMDDRTRMEIEVKDKPTTLNHPGEGLSNIGTEANDRRDLHIDKTILVDEDTKEDEAFDTEEWNTKELEAFDTEEWDTKDQEVFDTEKYRVQDKIESGDRAVPDEIDVSDGSSTLEKASTGRIEYPRRLIFDPSDVPSPIKYAEDLSIADTDVYVEDDLSSERQSESQRQPVVDQRNVSILPKPVQDFPVEVDTRLQKNEQSSIAKREREQYLEIDPSCLPRPIRNYSVKEHVRMNQDDQVCEVEVEYKEKSFVGQSASDSIHQQSRDASMKRKPQNDVVSPMVNTELKSGRNPVIEPNSFFGPPYYAQDISAGEHYPPLRRMQMHDKNVDRDQNRKRLPALIDKTFDETIDDEVIENLELGSLGPTITGEESLLDNTVNDSGTVESLQPLLAAHAQHEDKVVAERPFDEIEKKAVNKFSRTSLQSNSGKISKTSHYGIGNLRDQKSSAMGGFLARATKRKRRRAQGYRPMDDNDMDASFPTSPPFEISFASDATLDFSKGPYGDLDSKINDGPSGDDIDLLHDWNEMDRIPSPFKQLRETKPTFLSAPDPEPEIYPSSDDEGKTSEDHSLEGTDDPSLGSIEVSDDDEAVDVNENTVQTNGKPPIYQAKRKKKRAPTIRSSRSVVSKSSLLSHTIEEETAADLEDSSQDLSRPYNYDPYTGSGGMEPVALTRTYSAPNPTSNADGNLKMTGMNSYRSAEIFRRPDASKSPDRSVTRAGKSRNSTASRASESPHRTVSRASREENEESPEERVHILSSSASVPESIYSVKSQKKQPLFKKERSLRAALHLSKLYGTETSSSDESRNSQSLASARSRDARKARIRRMMGRTRVFSKLGTIDRNPVNEKVYEKTIVGVGADSDGVRRALSRSRSTSSEGVKRTAPPIRSHSTGRAERRAQTPMARELATITPTNSESNRPGRLPRRSRASTRSITGSPVPARSRSGSSERVRRTTTPIRSHRKGPEVEKIQTSMAPELATITPTNAEMNRPSRLPVRSRASTRSITGSPVPARSRSRSLSSDKHVSAMGRAATSRNCFVSDSSSTRSKAASIDSGLLDMLDVQLAELNRPEFGEIGSEEGSM